MLVELKVNLINTFAGGKSAVFYQSTTQGNYRLRIILILNVNYMIDSQ